MALLAAAAFAPRARAEAARDGVDTIGDLLVLAPFHMSVVRGGRVRGIMTVAPNLDVTDAVLRDRITRELPRVRDAYLRALDLFIDRIDLRAAPNVARMTELLQAATDQLYGNGTTKVLITHATIRRMG